MSTKNHFNKNSQYVQSLVDFILDTKPYHSKLTETVEEYQFSDNVNVKIEERMLIRAKLDSTWLYNYYSSGNVITKTIPIQRVVTPAFFTTTHTVGTDEDKDLALVPQAYSKKTFDNVGINTAFIRRADHTVEPLTESVDYFQSHGSYQFQIKQTNNANGVFAPEYSSSMDDGAIGAAIAKTRANALDLTNPNSAINLVRSALNEINDVNVAYGNNSAVASALNALYTILDSNNLPNSYEDLLAFTAAAGLPIDEQAYHNRFEAATSPLYFGLFTDMGVRESGYPEYRDVQTTSLKVTNIVPDPNGAFEEFTLKAVDDNTSSWSVTGSSSGFIGFLTGGQPFSSAGKISFNTEALSQPTIGDTITFDPHYKITIGRNVPLETWNIIKVNPIAHTRPILKSAHYGNIQDLSGVIGLVTLIDSTMVSTNIVLTSRADGVTFDLTNTEDLNHQGVATVGAVYNDGIVGFTINAGTTPYHLGDKFYIAVENLPAQAENVDLGYGYDMDPYDNDHIVDENGTPLGFYYDGRFTDYDLDLLNLVVTQAAVDGRKFRVRAIPDGAPIATIKKDGSGPSANVDLMDATSGNAPDPGLADVPVYSMADDNNASPDIVLYHTNSFQVECSDDDFAHKIVIGAAPVGDHFVSTQYGISFDLTPGSKPFIAASSDDGTTRVEGGDIFSFQIRNPFPTLLEKPIGLVSNYIPRLLMHSDSFFYAPAAHWTIAFDSPTSYTVSSIGAEDQEGVNLGTSGPFTMTTPGTSDREGFSFHNSQIHFTIVPNSGLFAGDVFTFDTFGEKPEYLVHGSVTGFTKPAVLGKYYWNGKIGFRINSPQHALYAGNQVISESAAHFTLTRLRSDTPSLTYVLTKTSAGYMVSRTDIGVIGFCASSGQYSDRYVEFTLSGATLPEIKLDINAHDYTLFNGQDVIIVKPLIPIRNPIVGDKVVIEKTENATLQISLTPGQVNVTALSPFTIDQRFIDLNTNNGNVPLASTSPETAILSGWLPTYVQHNDSTTSVAEFSDPAISHVYRSASNGQIIGTVRQQDSTNINEPILFDWDTSFFNSYLPLNAEANVVVSGTGWNDRFRAHISESIKFLIGGGSLIEDWLFHDTVNVNFVEDTSVQILMTPNGSFSVNIDDGPFGGFMAGYDNFGFDDEPVGYDEGQPPDLYSLLSNVNLSSDDLADIYSRWNNFLDAPVTPTTGAQWDYVRTQLGLDPNPGLTITNIGFGTPAKGMGMDITDRPINAASAVIQEAMIAFAKDSANTHDTQPYGTGLLDVVGDVKAIMYSGSLPPVPPSIPSDATYDTLDTPLTVDAPVRIFEISFKGTQAQLASLSPTFKIWLPGYAVAQNVPVNVVQRVSAGVYRFSIPQASAAKIIVG